MKRYRYLILSSLVILVALTAWHFMRSGGDVARLVVSVERDTLVVTVTATGELEAIRSAEIAGPPCLVQLLQGSDIKMMWIVPEGTKVRAGEPVAGLDPSWFREKLRGLRDECLEHEQKLREAGFDTAASLKESREQIMIKEFAAEDALMAIQLNKWEDSATQKRSVKDLKKAQWELENARKRYALDLIKAQNSIRSLSLKYRQSREMMARVTEALDSLVVRAPADGMVIYHHDQMGNKAGPGTRLSTGYDFIIAELPDLSRMRSSAGINETDINQVRPGQEVIVEVDAFPGELFRAQVREVAAVGETDPITGARIFGVIVDLDSSDVPLRPGMTSKNSIETGRYPGVLVVPVDAVFTGSDGLPCVDLKNGSGVERRRVVTGPANETHIIIRQGLGEHDRVCL